MKQIFAFAVSVILVFVMCISALAQFVALENFEKSLNYTEGRFDDVSQVDWFSSNVQTAYEYELMQGKSEKSFIPLGNITIAEAITLLARINCRYTWGDYFFDSLIDDMPWYIPYVEYCQTNELLDKEYTAFNISATRAEFAKILAASVDPIDLEAINIVDDGAIPDVDMNSDYAESVYLLYRAGVLSGSDANGTFNPDSTITRAEAAAIITRIIDPSLRKTIELVGEY